MTQGLLDVVRPRRGWSAVRSLSTSMSMAGGDRRSRAAAAGSGPARSSRGCSRRAACGPGARTARLPSAQPATRLFSHVVEDAARRGRAAHVARRVLRDDERLVALRRRSSWSLAPMAADCAVPDDACPSASSRRRRARSRCARRPSSTPMPARAAGSYWTRTAGCWPPPTVTCPTPVDLRDLLREHGVRGVEDLRERQRVARQREDEDRRVGGVDLAVRRLERQVRRQLAARRGDGRLDVARGGVDVPVEIELQRDRRRPERARRGHLGQPGDASEAALERRRDRGGHRLRARARELRAHLDGREVDARQRRDRQAACTPGSRRAAAPRRAARSRRAAG